MALGRGSELMAELEAVFVGGWIVARPMILAILITVLSSLLFWIIRLIWLKNAAFGTEVFAILFAVDFAVMTGLVEVWRLSSCVERSLWYCQNVDEAALLYRSAAAVLWVATPYFAAVAVQYERQSINASTAARSKVERGGELAFTVPAFDRWWLRAFMVRWSLSAVHMFFIIKDSKASLFP